MEPQISQREDGTRIEAVDALRGFALFGIVVAHMVEQFVGGPPPTPDFGMFSALDPIAAGAVDLVIRGKFFMMFSLLFGLSFFIQMDRAATRDDAFRRRFAWRLTVLFAIGLVHHLFYRGDILTIYTLVGFVLLLFYRVRDRTLLIVAGLLFLGLPRLLLLGGSGLFGFNPMLLSLDEVMNPAYPEILRGGSLQAVFATNLIDGLRLKLGFQFGLFGRGYQTLALFLVGLYLGRHAWHVTLSESRGRLVRVILWGVALCLVAVGSGGILTAVLGGGSFGPEASPAPWLMAIGLGVSDLLNLGMMMGLVAGFLLLLRSRVGGHVLAMLAPVGKTALSCYVGQTLLGTFLLYGWGFGLFGRIGASTALLLAFGIFCGQILVSTLWLRRFRYGPLEWVWRTATHLRLQPMRIVPGTVVPGTAGATSV